MDISYLSQYHVDKIVHMAMHGILGFLLKRDRLTTKSAFILSFFLGLAIEFCQGYFLPSRYFEIYDLIANIIGYFIGIGLYNLIKSKAYD